MGLCSILQFQLRHQRLLSISPVVGINCKAYPVMMRQDREEFVQQSQGSMPGPRIARAREDQILINRYSVR